MNRLRPVVLALYLSACAAITPRDQVIDYLALVYAAQGDNDLLVQALLDRGAPVDALGPDAAGMLSAQAVEMDSPLQAAARQGSIPIVRMLLEHKAWVDHRCCDSPAALGIAAEAGNAELVRILLQAGADPAIRSSYGPDLADAATPLDAARGKGHVEVVRILEAAMNATPKPRSFISPAPPAALSPPSRESTRASSRAACASRSPAR
jgi:ankyrin repeat protein